MVRIVNQSLSAARGADLTAEQRERALRRLSRQSRRNPLRRVRLACCELSVRDAVAQLGDHVWCVTHADFARVVDVVE